jgi:hypothetical protein
MFIEVEQVTAEQLNVVLVVRSAFGYRHDGKFPVVMILEPEADPSMVVFIREIAAVE